LVPSHSELVIDFVQFALECIHFILGTVLALLFQFHIVNNQLIDLLLQLLDLDLVLAEFGLCLAALLLLLCELAVVVGLIRFCSIVQTLLVALALKIVIIADA
jgi:hypothetical protein